MAIINALRAGVKAANKVTRSLQSEVSYLRAIPTTTGFELDTASPVTVHAVVEQTNQRLVTSSGQVLTVRAILTQIDVDEVVKVTNGLGFSPNDVFTLKDGATMQVVDIGGYVDPGTGKPIATEVRLG